MAIHTRIQVREVGNGRLSRVCRAVYTRFVGEVEVQNAEAMLELEREHLRDQVARYNRGLARHAAVCEGLRRRIAEQTREHGQLEAAIDRALARDDREGAARRAARLEQLERQRERLQQELAEAEGAFQELVRGRSRAVEASREKLRTLDQSIGDLRVQEALAEITELSVDLEGSPGVSSASVDRLRERVDQERDFAFGRVRVARDTLAETQDEHEEDELDADDALERYQARRAQEAPGEQES